MLNISVCIIGKNEEQHIANCLKPLTEHFAEVVFVDTGSTDNTINYVQQYTQHIYHYIWNNNFSDAKNYAISKASFDYILMIDCDEYLESIDAPALSRTVMLNPDAIGTITLVNPYLIQGQSSVMKEQVSRLFFKHLYRYEGIIHEQLTAKTAASNNYYQLPITFYHKGYETPELSFRKAKRNLELLLIQLDTDGPNPYLYYQIGKCYHFLNDDRKACDFFDLGLSMVTNPHLEYVQNMVEYYGYALLSIKEYQQALLLENLYEDFSHRADFLFLMGLVYMNNTMFTKAIEEFLKAVSTKKHSVEGVNSYLAYYNVAVIYECTGDFTNASAYYRKCGTYSPALSRLDFIASETGIK